jgi:hypothetical protein
MKKIFFVRGLGLLGATGVAPVLTCSFFLVATGCVLSRLDV